MRSFIVMVLLAVTALAWGQETTPATKNTLAVSGTRFLMNGKEFPYTGVSFFNAIYNPAFNESSDARMKWLEKFAKYGINVLRVWCQWDNKRGFVDAGPGKTLYGEGGSLNEEHLKRLKAILADCDKAGFVVELVLFSRESWNEGIRLAPDAADRAVSTLTRELLPYRNVTFQAWNEFDDRVLEHVKTIKKIDPKRLVTNSPGYAGVLGDSTQNNALDYLTPHTSRQGAGKTWELAPKELAYLIARYKKPVVDDEPGRNGTRTLGGPGQETFPTDHILHTHEVWKAGAYVTYHHDMFQTGYGTPAVPPSGVPDPEFSPYHRRVFEFIGLRERYAPRDMAK